MRNVFTAPAPAPTPSPTTLSGRLLVLDGHRLYVQRGAKRTGLGAWRDATWSPRGLFVGVAAGNTLAAIEPADGTVRWRLRRPAPVLYPRWAPGGLHIAYRSGGNLRIVYGNGRHDVLAGHNMAAVPPAWRPNEPRTVAWAAKEGTVTVEDADTAKVLWSTGPGAGPSPRVVGRRPAAARRRRAQRDDPRLLRRRARATRRAGRGSSPWRSRARLALAAYDRGRTTVTVDGRTVLTAPGRLRDLEWSPDGRRLLAGWPGADHWLVVRGDEVSAVRHRFAPDARTRGWATR